MNKEVDELREEVSQLNVRLGKFDEVAAKDFAIKVWPPASSYCEILPYMRFQS
jgi:hypothetical protein